MAHVAIDAGANLVVGHHPHVIQEIEEYNGGYIAYSLGNFVFNGFHDEETARDFLYVGMSRARDQLVIVGDFDELAAVGGKEFAKRLTKARTES